ncbi:hypothetical protein KR054_001728, partial [Drosophila jambulina]
SFPTMLTNWLLFVSLFLLTSTGTGAKAALIQPRIYGGQRTSNRAIGGVGVQIFYKTKLVCTGTLVTKRHLITAAHCFENMKQSDFSVIAGMSPEFTNHARSKKNGMLEVRLHPDFQKFKFIADIAVVKTQFPLKGPNIGYAKVCKYPLLNGNTVTVAGYGSAGNNTGERYHLRSTNTTIVGHTQCEKKLGRKMPKNILCASRYDRRTICNGDSGGPLLWRGQVCGIATWTWKCGDNQKPDVFMSVRHYAKFINDTIKIMGF